MVASHWTLAGAQVGSRPRWPLEARLLAAREAGFTGFGMLLDEYRSWLSQGRTDSQLGAMVAGTGMAVTEVEFLHGWTTGDPRALRAEQLAYQLSAVTGPLRLNVGELAPWDDPPPFDAVVERFADLCDRAAGHDVSVALEFVPWTGISSLSLAVALVSAADRPNGGLLLDSWHYFRTEPGLGGLDLLDPRRVLSVQLADGAEQLTRSGPQAATHDRLLPGAGDFDLVGFVEALDRSGASCPVTAEIMATDHSARSLPAAASLAFHATLDILNRAGEGEEATRAAVSHSSDAPLP